VNIVVFIYKKLICNQILSLAFQKGEIDFMVL